MCWLHRTSCSPYMLIAQDLIWFRLICWSHRTSCLPHMLIAQDLIWFRLVCRSHRTSCSPHMLIAQDLIWFRLVCWSHRTWFGFASYADCTGLDVRLVCWLHRTWFHFSFFTYLDLPLSAAQVEIWSSLKIFDSMEFIFFLPEGLSEAFIRCGTPLHSAFIFQIEKHVSNAVCRVMYDYVWMQCSFIGFHFMFFLFIKFATFLPVHTS